MATLWIGLTVFYSAGSPQRSQDKCQEEFLMSQNHLVLFLQPYVECVFCAVLLVILINLHCLVHLVTSSLRMQNPGVRRVGWHYDCVFLLCKTMKNAAKTIGCYCFHFVSGQACLMIKTDGKEAYGAINLFLRLLVGVRPYTERVNISHYPSSCFLWC